MKIAIKNRWDGLVIFEHDQEENTIATTVSKAVKEKINMREADLRGADLHGADLRGANLEWANLVCANLQNADLLNADLQDAVLCKANLDGVKWRNSQLAGANFGDADELSGLQICSTFIVSALISLILIFCFIEAVRSMQPN